MGGGGGKEGSLCVPSPPHAVGGGLRPPIGGAAATKRPALHVLPPGPAGSAAVRGRGHGGAAPYPAQWAVRGVQWTESGAAVGAGGDSVCGCGGGGGGERGGGRAARAAVRGDRDGAREEEEEGGLFQRRHSQICAGHTPEVC